MASSQQLLKVYKELERRIAEIDVRQGGPIGPRGPVGPKGRKGEKGSAGPKGEQGLTGKQGPQGATGPAGKAGKDGKDGKMGPQGPQGPAGRDGSNGLDGNHGRDGVDGVSVQDVQIDFDGHLTLYMSDGTVIDAGVIENRDGDTIVYSGGGYGGGGSGGGGDDPDFAGAGTRGYVPDPSVEQNWFLRDDGTWADVSGGGATPPHNQLTGLQGGTTDEYYHLTEAEHAQLVDWVNNGLVESVTGGNAITVDATDPANPIVNADEFAGLGTTGVVPDPVAENNYFLRDDGTFAPPPTSPIGGLALAYTFNTTTTPPIGAGDIAVNNTDQTLATELYVSTESRNGNDLDFIWANIAAGDAIVFWEEVGDAESDYYAVQGPGVLNAGVWTFPVEFVYGTGGIENNRPIVAYIIGNPAERVPAGGTTGQVLTKVSDDDYDDAWLDLPAGGGYWAPGTDPDDIVNTNSGNVGIGIDTPINKLVVDGLGIRSRNEDNRGILVLENYTASGDAVVEGTQLGQIAFQGWNGVAGGNGAFIRSYAAGDFSGTSTPADIRFETAPIGSSNIATRMTIAADGNVGIGTDAPDSLLHILGGGFARLKVESSGATSARLEIINGDDTGLGEIFFGDQSSNNRGRVTYDHSDNSMAFRTDNIDRMRIDSAGNVGIGTASPGAKLDVDGGIISSGTITAGSTLVMGQGLFTLDNALFANNAANLSIGRNWDNLIFRTGGTERMRIDSAGKVLVNRQAASPTTPSASLQVKADDVAALSVYNASTTGGSGCQFWLSDVGGTEVSKAQVDNNGAYTQLSDYRDKTTEGLYSGALNTIAQIPIYTGRMKWESPDDNRPILLAHEVQEQLPYFVNGEKDGEQRQMVQYAALTTVLIAAVQELAAEVEELKSGRAV